MEIDIIWYKNPTFVMNVLTDDKGALDVADLCKVHLSVDIYIQHDFFEPEFYEGTIEEEELNHEHILNV